MQIVNNAALIRDFIKDLRAESVVLEMCEERYAEEMQDILEHPKYDNTMATVHKLLERDPKRLLKYKEIAVD